MDTNGTAPQVYDPATYEQGLTAVVREMVQEALVYRQAGQFALASEVLRWVNALSLMANECGLHTPVQVLREQREARQAPRQAQRKSSSRKG